jgi:hypothetical protein
MECCLPATRRISGRPHKLPGAGITAFDQNASAIRGTNETVQVSSEAVAVEVAPSTDGSLMARNDAPAIEKAKPAPPGSDANEPQESNETIVPGAVKLANRNAMAAAKLSSAMNKASADNFAWAISAGVLRHSLDGGQSWQNALHADHPLLCYASHDQDVWAGGETGALFHSTDGGLTWANVKPSIEAQQLSSGITHIDLSWDVNRLREIVVSTSNNEVWSSADGGNTWNKK